MRDQVLVIDDIEINRMILCEILSGDYDVLQVASGMEAIELLFTLRNTPQLILLDIMMPGLDGFEVLEILKTNPFTAKIPVIFITASDANTNESKGIKLGAVDYISKPFNADVVKARVDNHIQLVHYRAGLEILVEEKSANLIRAHEQMLETMATIIEYRNLESGMHTRRVGLLTQLLVEKLLLHPKFHGELLASDYNAIVKAVALHDIGKIGIPDKILLKPTSLTAEEYTVIKSHTLIGAEIVESIIIESEDSMIYLKYCRDICRSHHERWDGNGYPDGLREEEIPLAARILSVVDVYDALVNKRCYKNAIPHLEALQFLESNAGTRFDPDIMEVVMTISDRFQQLEEQFPDGNIDFNP